MMNQAGKQLDQSDYPTVQASTVIENYSDAANKYINYLNWLLRSGPYAITKNFAYPTEYQLFTSDYALYWYDYKAGYDTVFAEFGWNYSQQLNVDLCRGAATVQNKDWGVMITWKYTQPPYIESGPDLYNDMMLAYENGAKYIIVFDSDKNWTQNILQQEQLDAMKAVLAVCSSQPQNHSPVSDRTAYVLPEDYAYGFRGPRRQNLGTMGKQIHLRLDISMSVGTLLQMFGNNLDIVYPDEQQTIESIGYHYVVYWNDSRLIADIPTVPSPSPVLSSIPSFIEQPTPSPDPQQGASFLKVYFYAIATSILVAVAVATAVLEVRRRR